MTYQVSVPLTGHAGWIFLNNTRDFQQEALNESPANKRVTDYFAEKIATITSAEELVADRTLREVALGAFGLQDDMENRAFIVAVLESNTYDTTSLAGRLTDKRYLTFARTFGFGDLAGARTGDTGFADRIIEAFQDRRFEISVGETDTDLRLALGLENELEQINNRTTLTNDARWYSVMASTSLRTVFETALGLPDSFGALDIEQQLSEFKKRAEARFGTSEIADFGSNDMLEKLTDQFLSGAAAKAALANTASSGQNAISLLSAIPPLEG